MSDRATVTEYTCFDRNCDKLNAPYSVISTVNYMTISYMKFNIQCVLETGPFIHQSAFSLR